MVTGNPATVKMLQDIQHCALTPAASCAKGSSNLQYYYNLKKKKKPFSLCNKRIGSLYHFKLLQTTLSFLIISNPLGKYIYEPLSWSKIFCLSDSRITDKSKTFFILDFYPSVSVSQALFLLTVFEFQLFCN